MKADVVIGANFGDEGKGLMTDYLASQYNKPLVVRFNSGAQAGHTVTTPDGRRHVFSHFGSGAFVGAETYLSEYFVANPILFFKELAILEKLGLPLSGLRVWADRKNLITTPYDMMINQIVERRRGNSRHGSCGLGFNETIQRNTQTSINGVGLTHEDIFRRQLVEDTLNIIRKEYVPFRLAELGFAEEYEANKEMFMNEGVFIGFQNDLHDYSSAVYVGSNTLVCNWGYDGVIFEGAQGLLLDQNHKWFPHVTRSNTGLQNVVDLANKFGIERLEVNYMTRSYLTRHGAGPMPFELEGKPYDGIVDMTNIPNDWQGSLRFSWFNFDLLKESIGKDMTFAGGFRGHVDSRIVVTCMDQLSDNVGFIIGGKIRQMSKDEFVSWIKARDSKMSFGTTRLTIE